MDRIYAFIRSVIFSTLTKVFGFFIVFGCLPLAALSLNTIEYATFNYSMTIVGIFTIVFTSLSALLVNKFARASLSDDDSVRTLAESTITMFLLLGMLILPLALIAGFYLTPAEFRGSIALVTIVVLTTNVLSWADVFRLGHRRDHVSSIFGLGNNISIISLVVLLYRHGLLSYYKLILIYYVSPLVWGLLSFLQLVLSRRFRIRLTVSLDDCVRTLRDCTPLVGEVLSDYIRLYVSSLVAFYLASPQAYAILRRPLACHPRSGAKRSGAGSEATLTRQRPDTLSRASAPLRALGCLCGLCGLCRAHSFCLCASPFAFGSEA